jgi:FkbM family methyltransferase
LRTDTIFLSTPLALPDSGQYHLLGDTELTQTVEKILQKLRPNAEFCGYVTTSVEAGGKPVIVCDPTCGDAGQLINERDRDDIFIMPLPIGDMWSWWEFSERLFDKIKYDDGVKIALADFTEMLHKMNRIEFYQGNRGIRVSPDSYLSQQEELIVEHKDKIFEVMSRLSDDVSRETYARVMTGSPEQGWHHYCNRIFETTQYFEYVDYENCNVVINGGVFDGFELPFLASRLPADAIVHNIDPLGHDYLTEYTKAWTQSASQQFVEHRFALAAEEGDITFSTYDDGQVRRHDEPGFEGERKRVYPARTLDDFVKELGTDSVDLIMFDLEGGDAAAIIGSLETIRKYRPRLALSIYHLPSDFWDIPRAIMNMCPHYDFHIGHYSFERWETILYALPKERNNAI